MTYDEGDKRYLRKYTQIPGLDAITTQITTLESNTSIMDLNLYQPLLNTGSTRINALSGLTSFIDNAIPSLDGVTSQISTLESNTSIMDLNLYKPLLNTGSTKINALSGLTSFIDSAVASHTAINPLNSFSLDPFMGVINLNTNLSTTYLMKFSDMPQNQINTRSSLSSLRSLSFGTLTIENQANYTSIGAEAQGMINPANRMFNFTINLTALTSITTTQAIMVFVPDRIFNVYDDLTYKVNIIGATVHSPKFNNKNIVWMYLMFRDHTIMKNDIIPNIFLPGTDSFAATRLYINYLRRIKLEYPATEQFPAVTVDRVFIRPGSSRWNACCGMQIINLNIIPKEHEGIYGLDLMFSLHSTAEKTIDRLWFPNINYWAIGAPVTSAGSTTWDYYYTQNPLTYFFAYNPQMYTNDNIDLWYQYLNSLM